MQINSISSPAWNTATQQKSTAELSARSLQQGSEALDRSELRETFDAFVGETFYGQLIKSMRETVGKPAYFDGGRAEEIFQGQLDQHLTKEIAKVSASQLTDPMFALFNQTRR